MRSLAITPIKPFKESKTALKYEFSSRKTKDYIIAKVKKGTTLGEHWHEGKVASKNPEIIIFIEGRAKIVCKHIETSDTEEITVEAPCLIEIYPFWYHEMVALTDITIIELGSVKDHQADLKE